MLAVKYRPRVLEDVVGQDVPVKIVRNILKRYHGKGCDASFLPNSIILEGPWGSGKTTLARILARYLNCEHGPMQACGECKSCQDIEHDRSRNLIEVDAASNRGIAEINRLKDRTTYKSTGRVMVVVLDEVHQLSKDAWAALLKVLEESPHAVLWVMATTDSHKILDTIHSRSTTLQVNTVNPQIAAERIVAVAGLEGITLSAEVAQLIAFISKGHMRDCLQLLETASVLADGEEVTQQAVYAAANLADANQVATFVNAFYANDSATLQQFIQTYTDSASTLLKSSVMAIHANIVNIQQNDPIPLADKILLIELLTKARMEFNLHAFSFPFIHHYFHQFQTSRVQVSG